MKERIKKKIANMSKISKFILKYGLSVCLVLLIAANVLLYTSTNSYYMFLGKELANSVFAAIAEVCIGAFIFDCCKDIN